MPAFNLNILKNMPQLELDKSKKRILLIYGLAALAVIFVYFNFLLRPSLATLFNLVPKIRARQSDIKSVYDDSRFEDNLKKKLQDLQEKMDGYEKMLSREKEIPMLLESLSKMAKSSRVKIVGITPLDKRAQDQKGLKKGSRVYQEVPIAISGQSGYHQLGAFINSLENDERYMQISNLKIKSNKNKPKRHDVGFVVHAYTFKQE